MALSPLWDSIIDAELHIDRLERELRDLAALTENLTADLANYRIMVSILLQKDHDDVLAQRRRAAARRVETQEADHGE